MLPLYENIDPTANVLQILLNNAAGNPTEAGVLAYLAGLTDKQLSALGLKKITPFNEFQNHFTSDVLPPSWQTVRADFLNVLDSNTINPSMLTIQGGGNLKNDPFLYYFPFSNLLDWVVDFKMIVQRASYGNERYCGFFVGESITGKMLFFGIHIDTDATRVKMKYGTSPTNLGTQLSCSWSNPPDLTATVRKVGGVYTFDYTFTGSDHPPQDTGPYSKTLTEFTPTIMGLYVTNGLMGKNDLIKFDYFNLLG